MKTFKWFGIITVVAVAAFLIGTAVSSAFAQGGGPWGNWGRGMMGGNTNGQTGAFGPGMTLAPALRSGASAGVGSYAPNATQSSGGNVNPNAKPITLEQAEQSAAQYAQSLGANLQVAEVMQFDNGFYAEIVEKDTGIG